MKDDYDVVIAGAGAGGGFAAMVLARQGLKVLLLERGKRYDYRRDFPMHHDDWEMQPKAFASVLGLFDQVETPSISPDDFSLCSGRYEKSGRLQHNQPTRRGRFQYQRALGLGGSTLHYQGEAHRYPEHAFAPASLYGWGQDWPFDYYELAPYYQRVEATLGVAGEQDNPFKPAREAFPTPAHTVSTRSQLVKKGAERLGWSLLPNTLALPSKSTDGRVACQHSGGCVQGCIFGAKSSTDLTAIRVAEKTGNLTILPHSRLLQIEVDTEGEVTGFVYKFKQKLEKISAKKYMLALGAVETPRVMLASQSTRYPNGIGNDGDNVGRYFMETISARLECRAEQSMHSYKGPPIDARIWDFAKPQAPLRSGFVLGVAGTLSGRHSPVSYAWSLSGIGKAHKQKMRDQFGRDIQLFGIAEHIPNRENRLTLSELVDQDGVAKVKLYSDYHEYDKQTLKAMIRRILEWADACELKQRQGFHSTYDIPAAAHVGGTCRMGLDPAISVTDSNGRVHGISNLYIADASVLPTLGAGDSPSLTIQALAMRTASKLLG